MEITVGKVLFIIYVAINLISFAMMGIDKLRAERDAWRISEKTLLLSAFLMGGVGSLVGSYVFRHKTQKLKFRILLPLALILNLAVIAFAIKLRFWYLPL